MVPSSAVIPGPHLPDEDEGRHHGAELQDDAGGDDAAQDVEGDRARELVPPLLEVTTPDRTAVTVTRGMLPTPIE